MAVAEDEVLVATTLLDTAEEEVLLGTVVPKGEQAVPNAEASLNVSANAPLITPYFVPEAELIDALPL